MSLFGNKWAGEILLETKRIHGLAHDASEQEVHEHLRSVTSYEDVTAAAGAASEEEVTALKSALAETERQKDALDNRVAELTSQVEALHENVKRLEKEAEALKADAKAKADEIEALKKEAAAEHTNGETDPSPGKEKSKTPKWDAFRAQHGL
ncbi:MAG: hypothetical protein E6R03_17180 [Hyphomicrobiaceae bacterium]|nr:MAG: hypothetical protein E6R03_17180 [Hyphomicrobiaceae bacterium]